MDVKMMHEMIEKLTECAKYELDKGVENVDTKEMGEVADIIKDLSEAMYYRTLTEAMKESEYGEDYDEYGPIEEHRYYRGQPRDSRGRYMSRRGRGRMGYEEPPYWHMTPDMYHDWDNMTEAERNRDIDRVTHGRMYYTGGSSTGGSMASRSQSTGGNMSDSETNRVSGNSRYENARRGYEEKKTMGADKQEKMKSLEEYMKELGSDLSSLLSEMSPEEKTMVKSKLSMLAQKVS